MAEMTPQQVHQVWLQAQEKVKDRVIAPTLYRALELGVGVAVDGDVFILGFSNADLPMAGHLRSSQHQALIEQCISEVLKRKVRLRIVEGTTVADYENYKRMQAAAEVTRSTLDGRKAKERGVEVAWEETAEKITRGYSRMQNKQFAQERGKFIRQSLEIINDAVNRLGYTEESDEANKRALARVFEKLATVVDVPSSLLAYEYYKLREDGKLK